MPDPFRHVHQVEPMTAYQSRTSWDVQLGGLRLAVTRTRESRCLGPVAPAPARPTALPFTAGAVSGVALLGLLVVGASAAPRAVAPARYSVSQIVPDAVAPRLVHPVARHANPGRTARIAPVPAVSAPSGERFDVADEPYVARAMATGEFQEWEDAAGQRRFLTAGPARAEHGRTCRNMALLVRLAEGGSHVRSGERCTTAPVSSFTPAIVADEPSNESGGADE